MHWRIPESAECSGLFATCVTQCVADGNLLPRRKLLAVDWCKHPSQVLDASKPAAEPPSAVLQQQHALLMMHGAK
jgi:hypothetical protein